MIFKCDPKINTIGTIYIENGPFSFDTNNMQSDVFYNKRIQIQNCYVQINKKIWFIVNKYFLHTKKGYLRFYRGIENLVLPRMSSNVIMWNCILVYSYSGTFGNFF